MACLSTRLIAVSSATTSTLVTDTDEASQCIEGINRGSHWRRRRGCSSWQMKRLLMSPFFGSFTFEADRTSYYEKFYEACISENAIDPFETESDKPSQ